MHWIKAGAVGALGSAVIFVAMVLGIQVTGFAPFNLPPSAAFLTALGIPPQPLAVLAHFGYGIAWAVILLAVFRERVNPARGIGVAIFQWLLLMLVYAPVIGWGPFGFGEARALPPDAPLHLGSPAKFMIMTLVLHVIYGAINGWLIPAWTRARTWRQVHA